MRIAHLSDLHFGRDQHQVADAIINQMNQLQPDLVIISGDLTQNATHEEFQAARHFLDQLQQPAHVVPGNHDLSPTNLPERFLYPWRKWQHYIQPDTEPTTETEDAKILGLNTARRMGWYLDWSRGRVNEQQMQRVENDLQNTQEEKLRIVVAHHPFWLPTRSQHRKLVGSRDEAITVFDQAGVDLVLGGHIHLAFAQTLQGVVISHAGTTTSDRLIPGQPNSFNLIDGNRHQLTITEWDWQKNRFAAGKTTDFIRQNGEWQHSRPVDSPPQPN